MKKLLLVIIISISLFSTEALSQLRKESKNIYFLTGMDVLPSVEGNGSLTSGGIKPFAGVGLTIKIDAVYVDGSISYIVADDKLFTVGAGVLFELPFKRGAVERPFKLGAKYKMYISLWEIHSINAHVSYNISDLITVYGEAGAATYSMKEGNKTEPTAQLGVKIGTWWK